jgi:hypothetical protein
VDKTALLVMEDGGPRMFRQGRKLKDSRLESTIASAMEVIYRNRKNHYKRTAVREAARTVRNQHDLAKMNKAIRQVSRQRVYMRNEMFKKPLISSAIKPFLASHMRNRS